MIPTSDPSAITFDDITALVKSLNRAASFGTIVTAVVALLPYVSDFFINAYVIGAFAAVWFAARVYRLTLTFKDGAQLGFLSGFYGLLAATGIYDFIWQILHCQLWKLENADRIFALLGQMVANIFRPSIWLLLILQFILAAICVGAFGVPAGILAVKIFQKSEGNASARP